MFLLKKLNLALSISLLWGVTAQAQSFICPASEISAEQAASVKKILPLFEDFNDNSKIATAIATLKNSHDSTVQIVNSLIAAYCPIVAATQGINDAQKSAEVRKFGLNVTRQAFSLASEQMIILDVELPTETVEKITALAKTDGTTPQEWVAKQITAVVAK